MCAALRVFPRSIRRCGREPGKSRAEAKQQQQQQQQQQQSKSKSKSKSGVTALGAVEK
ncbi:hypothetical protein ACM9XB_17170 [Xanthomonas sacchari]